MRRTRAGIAALVFCVFLSGCVNNRYLAPATSFRDSTSKTISTISAFYDSRNSYERDIYLDSVAADASQPVGVKDKSGQPTPLGKPVFSPASLKARLDALQLVGVYASRLYDLANSSGPSDFSTASNALGKNLLTLNDRFEKLGANDKTAATYVAPVASLIGTIGQMYLNGQRNRLVAQAVLQGGPQVNSILSKIKDDMDNIFALEISTGSNEELATLVAAYNHDRASLTYDQRVARLAQIKAAADTASTAAASAPSQLVSAMLDANNALLKSATAPKEQKPMTLATLNQTLSTWNSQIQTLANEIKPLVK